MGQNVLVPNEKYSDSNWKFTLALRIECGEMYWELSLLLKTHVAI
jgi:hypothetical protein